MKQSKLPPRCCFKCKYWLIDLVEAAWTEDQVGECHRWPPTAQERGNWKVLLDFVSTFAWHYWPEKEKDFPQWEEPSSLVSWPDTLGNDFCGEFKKK